MFSAKNYILEINRTKSFSKAAQNLYISQPSLSATIRRLEEKLGEPLFDRSKSPIILTEVGKEYVQAAQQISAIESDFLSYIEDLRCCAIGKLVVGCSNFIQSFVLPDEFSKFKQKYPKIAIEIKDGDVYHLRDKLLSGEIDILIDGGELNPSLYDTFLYKKENLVLAIPESFKCNQYIKDYAMTRNMILQDCHLKKATPILPLQIVSKEPFIFMQPGTDTYERSFSLFKKYNLSPNILLSFYQHATTVYMASNQLGCAFLSDTLLKKISYDPPLIYYKIDNDFMSREINYYTKHNRRMSYAMKAFMTSSGINF